MSLNFMGAVTIPIDFGAQENKICHGFHFPPSTGHAHLQNSAVTTGLKKVSFHSNPKERQSQRMFKLPHNYTHLTRFGIVNKAERDVFPELSCFFDDPADVSNLISCSSAFSKTSLNIWNSQFTYC